MPKVLLSKNIFPPIVELEISNIKASAAINESGIFFVKVFNKVKIDTPTNIKKHV